MTVEPEIDAIRHQKAEDLLRNVGSSTENQLPTHVIDIHSVEHFNELVNQHKDALIIVDFWAPWCGPCRSFAPAFSALQSEYHSRGEAVIFTKLNVDELGEISQQFGITGIPTTLFIKGKKVVYQHVGASPKAHFDQLIKTIQNKTR
jgi:thioredoxin